MSTRLTVGKVFTETNEGETKRVVRFYCPQCGEISATVRDLYQFKMCADCAHIEMNEGKN